MNKVINANLIDLSIQKTNKKDIINELAKRINDEKRLSNFDAFVTSAMDREELTSTGIGFGIAIPHGKSDAVLQTSICFGRLDNECDWGSLDNSGVKVVFLLAVPESCKGNEHLRIIAALSRKLIHSEFREQLLTLTDKEQIVQLINNSLNNSV